MMKGSARTKTVSATVIAAVATALLGAGLAGASATPSGPNNYAAVLNGQGRWSLTWSPAPAPNGAGAVSYTVTTNQDTTGIVLSRPRVVLPSGSSWAQVTESVEVGGTSLALAGPRESLSTAAGLTRAAWLGANGAVYELRVAGYAASVASTLCAGKPIRNAQALLSYGQGYGDVGSNLLMAEQMLREITRGYIPGAGWYYGLVQRVTGSSACIVVAFSRRPTSLHY